MHFWKQVGFFVFPLVAFGVFLSSPSANAQVCTNVPLYSLLCPSDNTGLTADTPSVLVAEAENCSVPAGSAPKCEHYCDATHEKSGNTCAFRSDKPLTVTKNGSGRVTSSPTGIDCGTACSARFQNGTSVTLTATPNARATFTGWSGACSGSGTTTCAVVMSEKRQVTANFSGPGGTCEDTEGQMCSANCETESGYEAGGTGTCTDTAKPQCCKKKELCVDQGYASCEMTTSCSGTPIGQFDCPSGQTCCQTGSNPSQGPRCFGSENAGLVPCGRTCDDPSTENDETKICTLCHLLLLIQNITDWIFMVMTYIAFAVLVAMGILYIVSTGKPQLTGMAKSGIWAALVGFAIVLLGWVAINVILMVLADGALGSDTASFAFKTNGKWFEYNCDTQTRYTGAGGTGGGNYGGDTGGGGGTVTCGEGGCAKDEKVKAAVQAQTYMPANDYMAILQAGEHYSEKTTCSNRSSPTGACGVSQTMPNNYRQICGFSSCEAMRADINKDIACGAKVAAGFKNSHNVKCVDDSSKRIDCTIDGLKSLAGCYNRGYHCNISPRNVNGKWYDCGERQGGKYYCDRVSEYAGSCSK